MRLYHFTDLWLTKLVPKIGEISYLPEELKSFNLPVIWLSNLPNIPSCQKTRYRYSVDVPDNDPGLHFDKAQQIAAQVFQLISDNEVPVWYYLTREIDVLETWEWHGTEYVKVLGG